MVTSAAFSLSLNLLPDISFLMSDAKKMRASCFSSLSLHQILLIGTASHKHIASLLLISFSWVWVWCEGMEEDPLGAYYWYTMNIVLTNCTTITFGQFLLCYDYCHHSCSKHTRSTYVGHIPIANLRRKKLPSNRYVNVYTNTNSYIYVYIYIVEAYSIESVVEYRYNRFNLRILNIR